MRLLLLRLAIRLSKELSPEFWETRLFSSASFSARSCSKSNLRCRTCLTKQEAHQRAERKEQSTGGTNRDCQKRKNETPGPPCHPPTKALTHLTANRTSPFPILIYMKLLPIYEHQPHHKYSAITAHIATLLANTVQRLLRTSRKHELLQLALFIFHAHAHIHTYHRFDRFLYAPAALLLAGKLTEQIEYPIDILREFRKAIRESKGFDGEDSEEKTKELMKKMFEAEVNLMVTIGFDFDLSVGLGYIDDWERAIGDRQFVRQATENLTKLYHTDIVLFFKPEALALTALSMTTKQEGLTLDICGWQHWLVSRLRIEQQQIQAVLDVYYRTASPTSY